VSCEFGKTFLINFNSLVVRLKCKQRMGIGSSSSGCVVFRGEFSMKL